MISDYELARDRMVREQIEARGVEDPRVLAAMRKVPRHLFVEPHMVNRAYSDHACGIGSGQTISQPYIVARMSELLDVRSDSVVLEIGTGSGYQTAVLAQLARRVYSLERIPKLAQQAVRTIASLHLENVKILVFDGTVGWSDVGPFDRILVTAGAPAVPRPLLDQLAPGGKLLIPEGSRSEQQLVLYEKKPDGTLTRQSGEHVVFVPLIGRHGWDADGS